MSSLRRWKLRKEASPPILDEIASLLRSSGVVVLPTDTIYGLHACALDADAVDRIFELKRRDGRKPLVVIASNVEQIDLLDVAWDPSTRQALRDLWPASLTAVVPLREPIAASAGSDSLAVRIPPLPWLRSLLDRTGPLASTSLNVSGEPVVEALDEMPREIASGIDGLLDAGRCAGKASTLVDFRGATPKVLREGDFAFTQNLWKTLWKTL